METTSKKTIVLNAFKEVTEGEFRVEKVAKYFSPNYVQSVDGKTLLYPGFVAHLKKQKETIATATVKVISIIEEGSQVFTNHEVTVVKQDGKQARFKVIANFTLDNDKIVACDELTRMIEGESFDRDLGSRH